MAPSTKETIRWSKFAKDLRADGLMIVNSYYGSITDEDLYQHFKAIAESLDLPVIPYNNLNTSGNNLIPEIVIRLTKDLENINYLKECIDTRRIQEIIRGTKGKMNVFMGGDG
jgi:4-hydroxy-tetrahydrodipicolinate synthase